MDYTPSDFEEKWQQYWAEKEVYKTTEDPNKPKYYVLDMFPYPSGAGLHVGHPLGYIATDIISRYKRMTGHSVLHPMGFDAFGLPAEQYAIETGQHPRVTTEKNIKRYKEQLTRIGFDYDWSRQVITSDPKFYRWTQWIFLKLFNSWYNPRTDKAESLDTFIARQKNWEALTEEQQQALLMTQRLAYQSHADVNWCPALGTVLANDEVKDGVSERGGHPVFRMKMRQWSLRITAYAERLLNGLDTVEWPDSLKEIQRNWIGRSEGARIHFAVQDSDASIEVFTTRPDTIFGATFMVLAPEHELVERLITDSQREKVSSYLDYVKKRSDVERMAEKKITGEFTGSYAVNPLSNEPIPIWVAEYVLIAYGTGAIMAVPSDDLRDQAFAEKFGLQIIEVIDRPEGAVPEDKRGTMKNSGFLDGMEVPQAIEATSAKLEDLGIGERRIQYKMRDAGFSRQRYWGEPFPIEYKNELPYALNEAQLPLELPEVQDFKPTGDGKSPIGNLDDWHYETDTMPGYAGSSWYFLRYMDPHNAREFCSKKAIDYWQNIDFYMGGAEHAVGHLLYSRFWHKFLKDLGYVTTEEPFKQMVNQGMIQAEDGQKMSKRYHNVINPDDVIEQHGADALRMFEMFLGPIEVHKPWDTHGIDGVVKFLRKFWRLFYAKDGLAVSDAEANEAELRILHKAIKKVTEDIERLSFNTAVSAFMIATNELQSLKCNKRSVLEQFVKLLAPFAPHITEQLWHDLGNQDSVHLQPFPDYDEQYVVEDTYEYPISVNGKVRTKINLSLSLSNEEVEQAVLENDVIDQWLNGGQPKKVIVVPGRIVNVVV